MARPHKKSLTGREAGNASQHWYDYVDSKRKIKRTGRFNGPRVRTRPGIAFVTAGPNGTLVKD